MRVGACTALAIIAMLAACSAVQAQEGGRHRRAAPTTAPDEDTSDAPERKTLADEFSAHLLDVQQRLKLQPAQQAAWNAYVQRVQDLMQDQIRGVAPGPDQEDAPHRIDRRVDVVRNRLAAMEDIADSARALYAQLSADQRKVADEMLPTTVPALYSGLPQLGRGARAPGSQSRDKQDR